MKTELDLYLQKLDYLQDRLIEFDGEENKSQREYLLSEIDQQKTELLKLEVETYFRDRNDQPKLSSIHLQMVKEMMKKKRFRSIDGCRISCQEDYNWKLRWIVLRGV